MKKLFLSAALAIVAIGGAIASSARFVPNHYSDNAQTPDIDCTGGTASCSVFYGEAWDKPASDGTRVLISPEQLALENYNP
ncbi:hypothetical protein EZ428_18590 [Pedobacter frigiditerrae]|uniref:Uncharacterized protein n=1 Tax=Pedobacter frigiditerrae TaxID=2530452 RepID=A0A4V2MI27_9SPHI|nr:DUF6520 family protein [Pedobacter frigiditerrae]TCC88646.1 hypothetical protein EZ428_18590 [Pedobacter frigiditerrae]